MTKKYFILFLLLTACAVPRPVSLDEMFRVKSLVEQARVAMASGKISEAESFIILAQEVAPNDPIVLDALGCLYWHKKDNILAESYFREALLFNPKFENAYLNLSLVLEQRGDIRQARDLLEEVLRINPLNHKARNNYAGMVYDYALNSSEQESARIEFKKAVNSAPEIDSVLKYNIDKFNLQ